MVCDYTLFLQFGSNSKVRHVQCICDPSQQKVPSGYSCVWFTREDGSIRVQMFFRVYVIEGQSIESIIRKLSIKKQKGLEVKTSAK